jgi:restriction endonuclease Mrr
MTIKPLQELVYYFQPEREVRPILLLGAGASFRSGVPVAGEMVRQIARFSYAIQEGHSPDHAVGIMEGDIQRHLNRQPWYKDGQTGEMFPYAVEHLLTPSSIRKAFFSTVMSRATGPTEGHQALADLVQRQLLHTILTTNFDPLIEDALRTRQPQIKEVVAINKSAGDIAAFSPHNRAQVIYLHGAFEYYRDRNSINETKRMDEAVVAKVRHMIGYAPLIVIGYRGYEPSVMEHLLGEGIQESSQFAHGIFWCVRKPDDIHENVKAFAAKIGSNFTLVQITSFDEAMAELNHALAGRAAYQRLGSATDAAASSAVKSHDLGIREDLSMDALESDQVVTMAKQYAKSILKVDLKAEELERFLESYALAKRDKNGVLRPTLGLYLLAGKDVTEQNPNLKTIVLRDGKHQTVFPGNLLKQFTDLRELLFSSDVNASVRIKRPDGAVEMKAYHERAILELLVNLMAHRDYDSKEPATIEYATGRSMRFVTPGGLPDGVFRILKPDSKGNFSPRRNVREIRNPVISDVFFSQGIMDKAGTGLVDTVKFMEEHYGAAQFSVGTSNDYVSATLIQAEATGDSVGQTAHPVGRREVFLTNLFPFVSIPPTIFMLPLDEAYNQRPSPRFFPEGIEDPGRDMVFIRHDGALLSFGDFRNCERFSKRVGYLEYVTEKPVESFITDPDNRRLYVQLLGRHWERFLKRKCDFGLHVDYKARRAFFLPKDGGENVFIYDSPQRRNIQRAVVKKRETPTRVEFENEGITYSIVQFGTRWAVQTKPFYVFTESDGKTPLSGVNQTRRATRRYKFDRNKAVEADMKFWSIFLAGQKSTMDLGSPTVSDLVLSVKYLEAEALEL